MLNAALALLTAGLLFTQPPDSGTDRGNTINVTWQAQPYAPLEVELGDTVSFNWASGHSLFQFVDASAFSSCNFAGSADLSNGTLGPTAVLFDSVGVYYFGCDVASHCSSIGMKIQITVIDPSAIFSDGFEDGTANAWM